jgi:malate permease and related proteins
VIGAGYFGQRILHLNIATIARLGLYILTPCLAFSALIHSQLSGGSAAGVITVMLSVTVALIIIGSLTGRFLGFNAVQNSSFLMVILFSNTGNYGVPLMDLAFGRASRDLAIICYVTQQLLFNTLAVWLATRGQMAWWQGLRKVFRMPLVYAVIAAVFFMLTGLPVPGPVDTSVSMLGEAALPIILLSLGLQLAETRPELSEAPRIGLGVVYRLVLSPALALLAVWLLAPVFGLNGLSAKVPIVAMAMPTAVTIVLLSIEFGADSRFTAGVVFISTLASAVSLTLILTFLI